MLYFYIWKNNKNSFLDKLSKNASVLDKAINLQKLVATAEFDWPKKKEILLKIKEEINELEKELKTENRQKIAGELGDVLFSATNLARYLGLDTENILLQTIKKFICRFKKMENEIIKQGLNLQKASLGEMEKIWNSLSD